METGRIKTTGIEKNENDQWRATEFKTIQRGSTVYLTNDAVLDSALKSRLMRLDAPAYTGSNNHGVLQSVAAKTSGLLSPPESSIALREYTLRCNVLARYHALRVVDQTACHVATLVTASMLRHHLTENTKPRNIRELTSLILAESRRRRAYFPSLPQWVDLSHPERRTVEIFTDFCTSSDACSAIAKFYCHESSLQKKDLGAALASIVLDFNSACPLHATYSVQYSLFLIYLQVQIKRNRECGRRRQEAAPAAGTCSRATLGRFSMARGKTYSMPLSTRYGKKLKSLCVSMLTSPILQMIELGHPPSDMWIKGGLSYAIAIRFYILTLHHRATYCDAESAATADQARARTRR